MIVVIGFVAAAGAMGIGRSAVIEALNDDRFPWGTLVVNATGALVAGVVASHAPESLTTVLGTAALGSFTTFSTFAVEVDVMWDQRRRAAALAYATATAVLAVGAAVIGLGL